MTIDAASEELSRKMQAWAKEKHEQEEELREKFRAARIEIESRNDELDATARKLLKS